MQSVQPVGSLNQTQVQPISHPAKSPFWKNIASWIGAISLCWQTAAAMPPVQTAHHRTMNQELVSRAIADFANDLSNRLAAQNDTSFAISPTSIVAALGMALKIVHSEKKRPFCRRLAWGR